MNETQEKKKNAFYKVIKKAFKWVKIELKISIFGKTVFYWVYPPQEQEDKFNEEIKDI